MLLMTKGFDAMVRLGIDTLLTLKYLLLISCAIIVLIDENWSIS